MIQARDATGRQVSLLNEDPYAQRHPAYSTSSQFQSAPDRSPLPPTPALLRSASYDSNASYDAISPLTPGVYDYSPRSVYDDYCFPEKSGPIQRPAYVESSRSNSYEDDSGNAAAVPERATKRYPCRYRDSHGCEKTFTTSGHASRHSKIHTAEKAVQCTYPGCHKKFTRADNMKQHLETHYKDKSRSSSSSKASCKSSSFSSKRAPISSKSSSSHSSRSPRAVHMWDSDQCGSDVHSLPLSGGAWETHEFNGGFVSHPVTGRTSSGLDALAAIACQEGA